MAKNKRLKRFSMIFFAKSGQVFNSTLRIFNCIIRNVLNVKTKPNCHGERTLVFFLLMGAIIVKLFKDGETSFKIKDEK